MTAVAPSDVEIFESLPKEHGVSDLRKVELACIKRALKLVQGNRAQAANLLGISERTLYRRLRPSDRS